MIPVITNGKLLYEQIYEFYREAILSKRLAPEVKLPSHRALSQELGVGINTVLRAYDQLVQEGYVRSDKRRGLFVMRFENEKWSIPRTAGKEIIHREHLNAKGRVKLTDQVVDEKNFPIKDWRKCSNWALDHINFQYEEDGASDPLKEQLIKYLYRARGVNATADRLLIGSGTNNLLFWLAFLLRNSFSKIIFEEPSYARTRNTFAGFDYTITSVPVKDHGIDVDKLSKERAALLYLTPSHQYPTGSAIPLANRIRILNWASKANAYIIEDDFDCEFRYRQKLMPSLQGLDKFNRVIYVGTFSNSIMPSLRVAYMVLPSNFPIDHHAYSYWTNTVPYVVRKTLAYFMERRFWERHLKRMKKLYQEKYFVCVAALKKLSPNKIVFNDAPSGLNILLQIHTRLSEKQLIRRALEKGIVITPASGFYHDKNNIPPFPQVLLEFGNIPLSEIEVVIAKLDKAWFD